MNDIALTLCISSCTKSTGSSVAVTNSFPPGAFPEYRLNCTQLSNGTWHCGYTDREGRMHGGVCGWQAGDGGQFALAIKNWQEPFVHKWDTSSKVTQETTRLINACECIKLLHRAQNKLYATKQWTWHCSPAEQQCDSFVELGVVCINYEDLYNEYSTNCTLLKFPVTTTQSSTTSQGKKYIRMF